jgi:tRNA(fMet)-specific endonuclease VapC
MLDTSIVSDLIRNPQGQVAASLNAHGEDGLCVSVITAAELRFGATKRASARLSAQVEAILSAIEVLGFEPPSDVTYGRLRVALEKARMPTGPNDLLIAAHALTLEATLVTDNVAEFSRVPGLRLENWLEKKLA